MLIFRNTEPSPAKCKLKPSIKQLKIQMKLAISKNGMAPEKLTAGGRRVSPRSSTLSLSLSDPVVS